MTSYTVNNIKVSFKACSTDIRSDLKRICQSSKFVTKRDINFFVLRKTFVYIAFFTGHINCTKLRSLEDLQCCQEEFGTFFDSITRGKLELKAPIVDNISASGSIAQSRINLQRLALFLQSINQKVRFNPETFPGLSFRISPVTFTIFTSGKFIAVGAQRYVDLAISISLFFKFIQQFFNQYESATNTGSQ